MVTLTKQVSGILILVQRAALLPQRPPGQHAAGLRLQAAGSNLNTWQIYLKNTQGTYSGLGQGKNWVQSALKDYYRIMK